MKILFDIEERPLSVPAACASYPCFESWKDSEGREYGLGFRHGREFWLRLHRLGTFIVRPDCSEVTGFPDPGASHASIQEVFLHFVAPLIIQRQEWDCLHASAVLMGSGIVAFCGPSGRGKSTLARACAERGAIPYADDSVPFLIRDGVVLSAHLPQRLRLRGPAASGFWNGDNPAVNSAPAGRLLIDIETTLRPLAAVYWLEPPSDAARSGEPVIQRVAGMECFRLLLSEAQILSLDDDACNRKMVRNYLALARLTPVFRLSFARKLDLLHRVLDSVERNQLEYATP